MFAQRQEEFSPFRSLVLKVSDSSSNVVIINKGFLGSCYAIAYTHPPHWPKITGLSEARKRAVQMEESGPQTLLSAPLKSSQLKI